MGLSFHYQGCIAKPEYLPELIDEVRDIVTVLGWEYVIHEQQFTSGMFGLPGYNNLIYGISLTPPNCETVSISFLSNGRISDEPHLLFFGRTPIQQEKEYLYMLSVKTQFAGMAVHQILIQLFRYLDKKYFVDFTLDDEGNYWETNDEELLKATFKKYTDLLDNFSFAIENFPAQTDETIETYFERLFSWIKKKGDT